MADPFVGSRAKYFPVSTRQIDWKPLVVQQWGPEYARPDTVYLFSNGRVFRDSQRAFYGRAQPAPAPTPQSNSAWGTSWGQSWGSSWG